MRYTELTENTADTVEMDVPLLIRALEFAREDAKDDMELHSVVERMIAAAQSGAPLNMEDYDRIFGHVEEPVEEGEEMGSYAGLKGWQEWNVVIMNNYYAGKYADYGARLYSVVAGSPEEAKKVVLDNADYVLQDLLSRKLQNGKKVLPRGSALPVEAKRIGDAKPGSLTTWGFKKMLTPEGPMSLKFSNGQIVGSEEHEVTEAFANPGSGSTGTSRGAKRIANTVRKALAKNAETPEQRAARKDFEARTDAKMAAKKSVDEDLNRRGFLQGLGMAAAGAAGLGAAGAAQARAPAEWMAKVERAKALMAKGQSREQTARIMGVKGPNPGGAGPMSGDWGAVNYAANEMRVKEGVAEGTGSNYAEQLAQQVFDKNPNLPTTGSADELLNAGYAICKRELGTRANGIFRDEDFPSDFVSAYAWLKDQGMSEAVSLDRSKNPNYPNDPATLKHRLSTAKAILSDPKSDPESRRAAAGIVAQLEKTVSESLARIRKNKVA